ncbi:MAG: helix-turn-helix transcriptional regulator [Bacteroidetes bacterium]|nr:helix-turn-helix transcriptional regulator [Bacteroidota bacterium]
MELTSKIIIELRNKLKWTQTDLAEKSKISRVMIGKYERNEAIPSLEAAKKIADAFEVTLDYLVEGGKYYHLDKKTIQRLKNIESLNSNIKEKLYYVIDAVIRDAHSQKVYLK